MDNIKLNKMTAIDAAIILVKLRMKPSKQSKTKTNGTTTSNRSLFRSIIHRLQIFQKS